MKGKITNIKEEEGHENSSTSDKKETDQSKRNIYAYAPTTTLRMAIANRPKETATK